MLLKKNINTGITAKQTLKYRILNFKAGSSFSLGDAAVWQKEETWDRDLPVA
jgi:hypothetical protein